MSTRATEAHFHASQGQVAHDVQAHGKRAQQGVHGKSSSAGPIGSAGFAQVLGEQVAKSSPKVGTIAKLDEPFALESGALSPAMAEHSQPNDTPKSPPAVLHAGGTKIAVPTLAQVRLGRSESPSAGAASALPEQDQQVAVEGHDASHIAEQARPKMFEPKVDDESAEAWAKPSPQERETTAAAAGQKSGHVQGNEAPGRQGATRAHSQSYATEEQRSQPGRIGSQNVPEIPNGGTSRHNDTAQIPSPDRQATTDTSKASESSNAEPFHAATASSLPKRNAEAVAAAPVESPIHRRTEGTRHSDAKSELQNSPGRATVKPHAGSTELHQANLRGLPELPRTVHAASNRSESPLRETNVPNAERLVAITATSPVAVKVAAISSGAVKTQSALTRDDASQGQAQSAAGLHQPWSPAPVLASAHSATDHSSAATLPTPKAQADSVTLHTTNGHSTPASAQPIPRSKDSQSGRVSIDAGRAVESRTGVAAAPIHHAPAASIATPSTKSSESIAPVASKPDETATRVPSQSTATSSHANRTPAPASANASQTAVQVAVATVHGNLPSPPVAADPQQAQPLAQPLLAHATKMVDAQSHDGQTPPAQAPHNHSANLHPAQPAPPAQGSARLAAARAERAMRTEEPSASAEDPVQADLPAGANTSHASAHKAQNEGDPSHAVPPPQAISPPISQPSQTPASENAAAAPTTPHSKSASAPEASRPTATKGAVPPQSLRPSADRASKSQETAAPNSNLDMAAGSQNPIRPATSEGNTAKTATDKPATVSAKQTPDTPLTTPNRTPTRTSAQAAPVANKSRTHLPDDEEPAEAPTASPSPAQTNPSPSQALSSASTEIKPVKSEASRSSENAKVADNSPQTSHVQPATAQPQAVKAEVHQTILPPANRPTAFVPQTGFPPADADTHLAPGSAAPAIAAQRAEILDRAINDPGLSVNVMPHSAHVSIAGDTGDLALHVRVRDGSADVNVSGTMAPLFNAKAPELRTVLAGEGLQLGSFATDQRGHSQGQQGQPESAPKNADLPPLPPPRRASTSAPEVRLADDRRIHVTA